MFNCPVQFCPGPWPSPGIPGLTHSGNHISEVGERYFRCVFMTHVLLRKLFPWAPTYLLSSSLSPAQSEWLSSSSNSHKFPSERGVVPWTPFGWDCKVLLISPIFPLVNQIPFLNQKLLSVSIRRSSQKQDTAAHLCSWQMQETLLVRAPTTCPGAPARLTASPLP